VLLSVIKQIFILSLTLALLGCTSQREVSLSEVLQQLNVQDVTAAPDTSSSPDKPDTPSFPMTALEATSAGAPGGDSADQSTIQPDSVLKISVAEESGLNGSYQVNKLGAISLGYIGPVILFNMTEQEAVQKIQDILLRRGEFNSATVSVKIHRASYDQCKVLGVVNSAGSIKLGAGDFVTLNNALVRAGGIKGSASSARVRVIRDGMKSPVWQSLPGEVYTFVTEDGKVRVPHVTLRNNDIAYVFTYTPPRARHARAIRGQGNWVLVLGEVNQEGFYRFTKEERFTMMNLYFKMGGLPQFANDKSVEVIRRDGEGYEERFKVNVRDILSDGDPDKDFNLEAGDRIIVKERRLTLF
jgi:protein involved in polysaccharide export with SLBB domain